MKNILKKLLNFLFGPYEIYSIYEAGGDVAQEDGVRAIGVDDISASAFPDIRSLASYAAPEALFFGIFEGGTLVAACVFWFGDTYRKRRAFITLPEGAAKLVQIVTTTEKQGRGLASRLIGGATNAMREQGYGSLYARIWRRHRASERAFEKAGWRKKGTAMRLHFLGKQYAVGL